MNQKRISVIVPVYNAAAYLTTCVDSILHQTYTNIELLLVDDGSKDDSLAICRSYADLDARVVVLSQENQGQGVARNHALDIMQGEYVFFVDSDDRLVPEALSTLMEAMEKNGADLAVCGTTYDTGIRCLDRISYDKNVIFEGTELLVEYLSTGNVSSVMWDKLYHRSLFEGIRFPDLRMHEDAFILPRIFGRVKKAVYVSEALYVQWLRDNSTERKRFSERSLAMIACEEELQRYIGEKHSALRPLIAYRLCHAYVIQMEKILRSFSYREYRELYRKLRESLTEEYEKAKECADERATLPSAVSLALEHPRAFMAKTRGDALKLRFKKRLKQILLRIKG